MARPSCGLCSQKCFSNQKGKRVNKKYCFFGLLHCNLCSSGDYIALRVISVIHSSLSLEVIDGLNYSMPHDKLVKVLEMLPTGKELDGVNFY